MYCEPDDQVGILRVSDPLKSGVVWEIPQADRDRAGGLTVSCEDGKVQVQREGVFVWDERQEGQEVSDHQPRLGPRQQRQLRGGHVRG